MSDGARRQTGVPLSVKLMLVTSALVAAAVSASALSSLRGIEQLARENAAARRASGEAAIQREAQPLARNVAGAAALPLAGTQLDDLQDVVAAAQKEYGRIQWLLVVDRESGKVVARTEGAPGGDRVEDDLGAELANNPAGWVASRRVEGQSWTFGTAIRVGNRVVGELRMGVSTADLEGELAASIKAADDRARRSMRRVWLMSAGILAIGVLLAALEGVRLARPLRLLASQAARIAGGDLDQRVPEDCRDEIGNLASNFNFMAGRLRALIKEQASKASMEREMSLARDVQQSMIPKPDLHEYGPLKLIGHCVPASSCGGDWWTYRRMSDTKMLLVIGDATGHGIHSAMIAGTARGAVEALAEVDEKLLTPQQVLMAIDSAVRNVGDHKLLMTCFAAVIDPRSGSITYANAGHNFPYIVRMGEGRVLLDTTVMTLAGNPLGDPQVRPVLQKGQDTMRPGDVLVCFSDGVVERANKTGRQFGDKRLRGALIKRTLAPEARALLELRDSVLGTIETFADGQVAEDDVTFVLCQFDPPPPPASAVPKEAAS